MLLARCVQSLIIKLSISPFLSGEITRHYSSRPIDLLSSVGEALAKALSPTS